MFEILSIMNINNKEIKHRTLEKSSDFENGFEPLA